MSEGAPRGRPEGGQPALLQDLLGRALDPGYAAAARRRAASGASSRHWWDGPAVALGCLLAGFVLVVAYVHTHRDAPDALRVHQQLVEKVTAGEQADSTLSRQIAQASHRLAAAQARALPSSGGLRGRVARDQAAGALTPVHGQGLVVTLREPPSTAASDAAGRAGSTPIDGTFILTDRDISSVVNELWDDGAEAIAVNGIRLTATSAIRFAGQAVLVDFVPITSPYTVEAIGDADSLATRFADSAVAGRYQTLVSADGIGFGFDNSNDLTLPAGTSVNLRYAAAGR